MFSSFIGSLYWSSFIFGCKMVKGSTKTANIFLNNKLGPFPIFLIRFSDCPIILIFSIIPIGNPIEKIGIIGMILNSEFV